MKNTSEKIYVVVDNRNSIVKAVCRDRENAVELFNQMLEEYTSFGNVTDHVEETSGLYFSIAAYKSQFERIFTVEQKPFFEDAYRI